MNDCRFGISPAIYPDPDAISNAKIDFGDSDSVPFFSPGE